MGIQKRFGKRAQKRLGKPYAIGSGTKQMKTHRAFDYKSHKMNASGNTTEGLTYWPSMKKTMPFHQRKSCILQYQDMPIYTSSATQGVFGGVNVYNMNSLLAPLSGGGASTNQPTGFDQLATLYGKYKVNAVKVQLEFNDPSEDGMACAFQFLSPAQVAIGNTIVGSSIADASARPDISVISLNNTGTQKFSVGRFFKMHKLGKVSKIQFEANIENWTALTNASPSFLCQLAVGCASYRTTNQPTVIIRVRILYYCTFYELKTLALSEV